MRNLEGTYVPDVVEPSFGYWNCWNYVDGQKRFTPRLSQWENGQLVIVPSNTTSVELSYEFGCVIQEAIELERLDHLEWMHQNYPEQMSLHVCRAAVYANDLNVLEWAIELGYDDPDLFCIAAGTEGSIPMMEYMKASGCPMHPDSYKFALDDGLYENAQWPFENGCPFNESFCEYFAENCDIDALKLLRAHGCPLNYGTLDVAVAEKDVAEKEYYEYNRDWAVGLEESIQSMQLVEWLIQNGCPTIGASVFDENHKNMIVKNQT